MDIFFSKNLKFLRKSLSISQKEIAKKLDKGVTAISAWEQGQAYPNAIGLIQLSQILKVSVDDLLNKDLTIKSNMDESESTSNMKYKDSPRQSRGIEELRGLVGAYQRMAERQEKEIERLYKVVDRIEEENVKLEQENSQLQAECDELKRKMAG